MKQFLLRKNFYLKIGLPLYFRDQYILANKIFPNIFNTKEKFGKTFINKIIFEYQLINL